MIIRKPYAFLIKNFKLIHFIMLIVSTYLAIKTNIISSFFKEYASTRQVLSSSATLAKDTIPTGMILLPLIIIALSILIIILFKEKDKPILYYFISVVFYIALIVISIVSRQTIYTIYIEGIEPKMARLYRDIWLIVFLLQIAFVVVNLIRTIGFDFKKFNFGEDLQQLKIDEIDNEEVEITTGFDAEKYKMKMAMQREELKSFFYEYKGIIIVILILLFIVLPGSLYAKYTIENKRYKEGEVIKFKNYDLQIVESYITKLDYKGLSLFKDTNNYLIVKFNIINNTDNEITFNLDNLRVETKNDVYMPKVTYYNSFLDIGKGYSNQRISKGSKEFIAVYIINETDINDDLVIRYTDKLNYNKKEANAVYKRISLKPVSIDEKNIEVVKNVPDLLEFADLYLKNTNLKILEYNISEQEIYQINGVNRKVSYGNDLVLTLSYEFKLGNINFINIFSDLLEKYATLYYVVDGTEYSEKINNITPTGYVGNKISLAVNKRTKNASSIYLVFKVRNVTYKYNLK